MLKDAWETPRCAEALEPGMQSAHFAANTPMTYEHCMSITTWQEPEQF